MPFFLLFIKIHVLCLMVVGFKRNMNQEGKSGKITFCHCPLSTGHVDIKVFFTQKCQKTCFFQHTYAFLHIFLLCFMLYNCTSDKTLLLWYHTPRYSLFFYFLQDLPLAADLAKILRQADQPLPDFLQTSGTSTYRGNKYGGSDVRVSIIQSVCIN